MFSSVEKTSILHLECETKSNPTQYDTGIYITIQYLVMENKVSFELPKCIHISNTNFPIQVVVTVVVIVVVLVVEAEVVVKVVAQ